MTTVKQTVSALDNALTELTDRIVQAQRRVAELEAQATRTQRRMARGTGDYAPTAEATTPNARPAPQVASEADLEGDLERILRAQPISAADSALLLGVSVARVAAQFRLFRRARKIVNAGTHERPLWSWWLGDDVSTTEIVIKVEQLLRIRPMTLAELVGIVGARRNRVSGALVILRRHGVQIDNSGNNWRAVWSIASPLRKSARAR